ncbi:MAG: cytochrome c [Bacteroidetes bacterium]|nr:cytochrome c [Bacteroidota bacterium]
MRLNTKRFISAILVSSFFIYSIVIYTTGTAIDKGVKWRNESSKKGKLIFQRKNCIACHQIYGLGGFMGPDLTNVVSAEGKGPAYIRIFLQNGSERMPNFHLSATEVDDLIAFLVYTDKTGVSPVKRFTINYDGTVNWKGNDEKGN